MPQLPHHIRIRGARENNLKNINLDLPHGQLIAITGLSGSGIPPWPLMSSPVNANAATWRPSLHTPGNTSTNWGGPRWSKFQVSDPAFSIYPNPGTGLFYLESPRPFKPVEYRVQEGCGRLVRQGRIDPANPSVDLQVRSPGLYFLCLESGDVRSSTKLILRRP